MTGGKQFLVRWVSIDGVTRDLADLPGEPLAGSWVWAPDGHEVAFLVRISTTALVALNIDSGELRYLDDLRADGLPTSGAVARATWVPSAVCCTRHPRLGTGFGGSAPRRRCCSRSHPAASTPTASATSSPCGRPSCEPTACYSRWRAATATFWYYGPSMRLGMPSPSNGSAFRSRVLRARWDLSHQQLLIVRGARGRRSRGIAASICGPRTRDSKRRKYVRPRRRPMIAVRPLLGALGAAVLLSLGILAPPSSASIAAAAPDSGPDGWPAGQQ